MITRRDGMHVIDEQGCRYIECTSVSWCSSLGFSYPRPVQADIDALQTHPYCHTFNHRSNPAVAQLADRLIELPPSSMAKVFFANSGSIAPSPLTWEQNRSKQCTRITTASTWSMPGLAGRHWSTAVPTLALK
ncbi:MAG: hypothetical protein RSD57_11110 [Comamonas sp.]